MQRRTDEEVLRQIVDFANDDERVRAVVLSGSRNNSNVVKDKFQDFDVVFIVSEISLFVVNLEWINVFGEKIIMQTPNVMEAKNKEEIVEEGFSLLMLFEDGHRIDLTLHTSQFGSKCIDSLSTVIVDKDDMFNQLSKTKDNDYWVQQPTEKEFLDCCNEFWWVSTYVVKGLCRNEIIYSKDMMDKIVRKTYNQLLAWETAHENNFEINLGKSLKFITQYINEIKWNSILSTYSDGQRANICSALIKMQSQFDSIAKTLANQLSFNYNSIEAENVKEYTTKLLKSIL